MNNMMSSANQYETLDVRNFTDMQENVSPSYSSAINSQYMSPPQCVPMDMTIGYATTSYLANYSQPSYATPHVTNYFAPYAAPS